MAAGIPYHHIAVERAYRDISNTVVAVFGTDSPEVNDFKRTLTLNPPPGRKPSPSILEPQHEHMRSLRAMHEVLVYLLRRLNPAAADAYYAFGALAFDLHPQIAAACMNHFRNGEYRSAVLDACVALRDLVRQQSGRDDLDGQDLACTVFSAKKPILAFNDCASESDKSEQQGLMHMFQGAFLALRNPRAHRLDPDSREEAIDYITLLNILAKQLKRTKRIE